MPTDKNKKLQDFRAFIRCSQEFILRYSVTHNTHIDKYLRKRVYPVNNLIIYFSIAATVVLHPFMLHLAFIVFAFCTGVFVC